MTTLKDLKRTYQAELQTLPVQLVPPDPFMPGNTGKKGQRPAPTTLPDQPEVEREVVNKLISKLKRI